MCNLYTVIDAEEIAKYFRGKVRTTPSKRSVAPVSRALIIVGPGLSRIAQWGMIPRGSEKNIPTKKDGERLFPNNARREGLATA